MAEKLEVIITGTDQLSGKLDGARSSLTRLGGAFSTVNSALATLGTVGVAALGAIATRAGAASLAAIRLGSDAEEMMGKFNMVFGEFSGQTIGALDAMAEQMGRSRFELREFASTFQDTFVPLGFARDEAAEMSTALTELTVDLASFNNMAEPDVMNALQSAIVGNHETMRQFGVIITEATLEQELLNMGIQGGTRAATEQEKALARLNLIMEGTADAQGDAVRTSDSLANRLRTLKGSISDLTTDFGLTLLPAITGLLDVTQPLIDQGFDVLRNILEDDLAPAIERVTNVFDTFNQALALGADPLDALITAVFTEYGNVPLVGALHTLQDVIDGFEADGLSGALRALVGDDVVDDIEDGFAPIITTVKENIDTIEEEFEELGLVFTGEDVLAALTAFGGNVALLMVSATVVPVTGAVAAVGQLLNGDLPGAIETAQGAVETSMDGVATAFGSSLPEIQTTMQQISFLVYFNLNRASISAQQVLSMIPIIARNALREMAGAFQREMTRPAAITAVALSAVVDTVTKNMTKVGAVIGDKLRDAVGTMTKYAGSFVGAGSNLMQGLIDGIAGRLGDLLALIRNIGQQINDEFANIEGITSPSKVWAEFGQYIMEGLAGGLDDNAGQVLEQVRALAEMINQPIDAPAFGSALVPQPALASASGAAASTQPTQPAASRGIVFQGATINISVQSQPGDDVRDLANRLYYELSERLQNDRQAGSSFIGA